MARVGKFWKSAKQKTSGCLDSLLDNAEAPSQSDSGLFISSGLRAARVAQSSHRRTILKDLSIVLRCNPDELGFLFMDPVIAANDSDPVAMPDFRATLTQELRSAAH